MAGGPPPRLRGHKCPWPHVGTSGCSSGHPPAPEVASQAYITRSPAKPRGEPLRAPGSARAALSLWCSVPRISAATLCSHSHTLFPPCPLCTGRPLGCPGCPLLSGCLPSPRATCCPWQDDKFSLCSSITQEVEAEPRLLMQGPKLGECPGPCVALWPVPHSCPQPPSWPRGGERQGVGSDHSWPVHPRHAVDLGGYRTQVGGMRRRARTAAPVALCWCLYRNSL